MYFLNLRVKGLYDIIRWDSRTPSSGCLGKEEFTTDEGGPSQDNSSDGWVKQCILDAFAPAGKTVYKSLAEWVSSNGKHGTQVEQPLPTPSCNPSCCSSLCPKCRKRKEDDVIKTEALESKGSCILFCPKRIFNDYSPKWRWIAVDIYRGASAR